MFITRESPLSYCNKFTNKKVSTQITSYTIKKEYHLEVIIMDNPAESGNRSALYCGGNTFPYHFADYLSGHFIG